MRYFFTLTFILSTPLSFIWANSKINLSGVMYAYKTTATEVSIKDEFGQVFVVPRKFIPNNGKLLTGTPVSVDLSLAEFKALRMYKVQ